MRNENSEVVQLNPRHIMELRHENHIIRTILNQWLSGDVSWSWEQTLIAMVIALSKDTEEIRKIHIDYILRNSAPITYDPIENKTENWET